MLMDYERVLVRHELEEKLRGGSTEARDVPAPHHDASKQFWAAVLEDRPTMALALVRRNHVDVNDRDGCGRTALWHCAWHGRDAFLGVLLELGADAAVCDGDGDGPLAAAARRGEADSIGVLLKHGCPRNSKNDDGRTALWHAASYGRTASLHALLRGGADANAADRIGGTPLHAACSAGRLACARALLESGADARRRDGDGRTCLHAACQRGDVACVQAIVDALEPTALNDRDALGQTALWLAARDGSEDICAALLERGADSGIAANSGRLPREIAELYGHEDVVDIVDGRVDDGAAVADAPESPPESPPQSPPPAARIEGTALPEPHNRGPVRALESGFVRG